MFGSLNCLKHWLCAIPPSHLCSSLTSDLFPAPVNAGSLVVKVLVHGQQLAALTQDVLGDVHLPPPRAAHPLLPDLGGG